MRLVVIIKIKNLLKIKVYNQKYKKVCKNIYKSLQRFIYLIKVFEIIQWRASKTILILILDKTVWWRDILAIWMSKEFQKNNRFTAFLRTYCDINSVTDEKNLI